MKLNLEKINNWFERRAKSIIKYRWLFLGIFVVALFIGMYGATKIKVDVSTENLFLEDDPMRIATDKFKETFGNDEFIGILIETEDVFTYENLSLIKELGEEILDSLPFADQVISLTDYEFTVGTEFGMSIEQIVPEKIPTSQAGLNKIKEKAFSKENVRKSIVSSDSRYSWLMVKLLPFPKDWKEKYTEYPQLLVGEKITKIINQKKYDDLNLRATGLPYNNYQKRIYFDAEAQKVMGLALILTLIVLALSLRSVKGVIIPVITAISSIVMVNGIIGFSGITIDNMVMSFPVLIGLAVALAYSIHIFSFYRRNFRNTGKRKESTVKAVGEMGWPIFFTALTTVTALMSFIFIPIKTVRFIGLATAGVVGLTYFIVIIITPALLSFGKDKAPKEKFIKKGGPRTERWLGNLGNWVLKKTTAILITYIIICGIMIYGITKVESNVDPVKSLGLKVPYVKELYGVSETELGAMFSYDLTIKLPEEGMAKDPQILRDLDILTAEAENYPQSKRVSSLLDVVKDMNQVLNEDNPEYYVVPESSEMVAQLLLLYENAGGSEAENWVDYEYQTLRVCVLLEKFNADDAIAAYEMITKRANELFPDAEVSVVGSMPQFVTMMSYIINGQMLSFGIALLIITVLLMIVFGNVKTGLVGLIPNITPAIFLGGIMGYMGIPLDTMVVLIMPMVLGLAVDDTIHFINHGKFEFQRTGCYRKSIIKTFRKVGVALLTTTIVLSTNFAVYMSSDTASYFNMGILSVTGIVSALLADYFVAPPLFKAFRIYGKEETETIQ